MVLLYVRFWVRGIRLKVVWKKIVFFQRDIFYSLVMGRLLIGMYRYLFTPPY